MFDTCHSIRKLTIEKIFDKFSLNIQMLCYFCGNSQIYPRERQITCIILIKIVRVPLSCFGTSKSNKAVFAKKCNVDEFKIVKSYISY